MIYNVVFNPFSSRVGPPLHNTPFLGFLMKSIGALFYDRISFVRHLYDTLLIKTTLISEQVNRITYILTSSSHRTDEKVCFNCFSVIYFLRNTH